LKEHAEKKKADSGMVTGINSATAQRAVVPQSSQQQQQPVQQQPVQQQPVQQQPVQQPVQPPIKTIDLTGDSDDDLEVQMISSLPRYGRI
jgi:DNA segregation ATPase FtsK/SpoIIIE-like protein